MPLSLLIPPQISAKAIPTSLFYFLQNTIVSVHQEEAIPVEYFSQLLVCLPGC
jgi:hypothetical protein